MAPAFRIEVPETPSETEDRFLSERLLESNTRARGEGWHPFQVLVRDGCGGLVGGISGGFRWGAAQIDTFWLEESLRGRGLGREILRRAEDELRVRGCRSVDLHTFDFQAPAFYRRAGYHVLFELAIDPSRGIRKIFFRKPLDGADPDAAIRETPRVHLMHGFIGSGKSTCARRLEAELGALRIVPDDWMSAIHGSDPPTEDFARRLRTLFDLLEAVWIPAARAGAHVILDYGFWTRASRREIERKLASAGTAFRWVCMATPLDECRRRNSARQSDGSNHLNITDATFDALARDFEPVDDTEWDR
jgi:hypothetical protein